MHIKISSHINLLWNHVDWIDKIHRVFDFIDIPAMHRLTRLIRLTAGTRSSPLLVFVNLYVLIFIFFFGIECFLSSPLLILLLSIFFWFSCLEINTFYGWLHINDWCREWFTHFSYSLAVNANEDFFLTFINYFCPIIKVMLRVKIRLKNCQKL